MVTHVLKRKSLTIFEKLVRTVLIVVLRTVVLLSCGFMKGGPTPPLNLPVCCDVDKMDMQWCRCKAAVYSSFGVLDESLDRFIMKSKPTTQGYDRNIFLKHVCYEL